MPELNSKSLSEKWKKKGKFQQKHQDTEHRDVKSCWNKGRSTLRFLAVKGASARVHRLRLSS